MDSYLRRKYETSIRDIEVVHKEDLDLVRLTSMSTQVVLRDIAKRAMSDEQPTIVALPLRYIFTSDETNLPHLMRP